MIDEERWPILEEIGSGDPDEGWVGDWVGEKSWKKKIHAHVGLWTLHDLAKKKGKKKNCSM